MVYLVPGEAAVARWLLASLLLLTGPAWAHGGGLDANGCHHDRKTGGYHCHRPPGTTPSAQASALFSEPPAPAMRGTSGGVIYRCASGYTTTPAPGCVVVAAGGRAGSPLTQSAQGFMSSPQRLTARSAASYANCSEARAAGAAPVRAGDPGYSRKLDRDGDGVGCE